MARFVVTGPTSGVSPLWFIVDTVKRRPVDSSRVKSMADTLAKELNDRVQP